MHIFSNCLVSLELKDRDELEFPVDLEMYCDFQKAKGARSKMALIRKVQALLLPAYFLPGMPIQ